LAPFITKSIEAIETGNTLEIVLKSSKPVEVQETKPPFQAEVPKSIPSKNKEDAVGANDKLAFALDNRHLAGKSVSIANDKNITINGKVVGLDAPFVIVQTEAGPTIKVPLEKVSL